MNARSIIENRFIKPFRGKESHNIGVELEFPLINKNGRDIDLNFVAAICDYLEDFGFHCVLTGVQNEKLFMENSEGDCLSFDNSYNNFEFSLMHNESLIAIYERFCRYYEIVQTYLEKGNHSLYAQGSNPNYKNINVNHVPFSTYNMVSDYLHTFKGNHDIPDFPAFMSSVQTHLDTDDKTLPRAYTFFARIDFLRGILFHNSPDFFNKGYRIYRDYLWENSGFGKCPEITGAIDYEFKTTDDIVDFYLKKGMFNRIRNGKYEVFKPVLISEYFENPSYGAKEEDIECYLSFRNVEATSRGTLEVRSDCTQKEGMFFTPPAFNLGLMENLDKGIARLDEFVKDNSIALLPSEMRKIVTDGKDVSLIAPKEELDLLQRDMIEISKEGLIKRGFGEEKLLVFNAN